MSPHVERPSRLRAWRKSQGLTLQEVADLTGYSTAMISRAERGEREPSTAAKVKIARRLRVRISELFGEAA
jgi:XRE family transcriptional regulator, regulator of sulfur utilization